jgi:thioredoxin 1
MALTTETSLAVSSQQFESEVLNAALPTLVDFSATWCGPCRSLGPTISELAREFAGRVQIRTVDIDLEPDLTASYGVMSVPTLVFFRNGHEVGRVTGNVGKAALAQALERLGARA